MKNLFENIININININRETPSPCGSVVMEKQKRNSS